MLLVWVFFFGSGGRSASSLFLHIIVFAIGFLLLQKWVIVRAIYAFLGDQFKPKCEICSDALQEKEFEELIEKLEKEFAEDRDI